MESELLQRIKINNLDHSLSEARASIKQSDELTDKLGYNPSILEDFQDLDTYYLDEEYGSEVEDEPKIYQIPLELGHEGQRAFFHYFDIHYEDAVRTFYKVSPDGKSGFNSDEEKEAYQEIRRAYVKARLKGMAILGRQMMAQTFRLNISDKSIADTFFFENKKSIVSVSDDFVRYGKRELYLTDDEDLQTIGAIYQLINSEIMSEVMWKSGFSSDEFLHALSEHLGDFGY